MFKAGKLLMRTLLNENTGASYSKFDKSFLLGNQEFQQVLFHAFFTKYDFEKIYVEKFSYSDQTLQFKIDQVFQALTELTQLQRGEVIYSLFSSELGTDILQLENYNLLYKKISSDLNEIPTSKLYFIQNDLSPILIKNVIRELGNNLKKQPFTLIVMNEGDDFFQELHGQPWITPRVGIEWGNPHLKVGIYNSI